MVAAAWRIFFAKKKIDLDSIFLLNFKIAELTFLPLLFDGLNFLLS